MSIVQAINHIKKGQSLTASEMEIVFGDLFSDPIDVNEAKSLLVELHRKGESEEEILGAARFLLAKAIPLSTQTTDLIDCCGTGGDQKNSFNISTAVAFVLAGAGCNVAKHGNRAMSSSCGSADILKALNVNVDASPETVVRCIEKISIGFLFAPLYQPLLKKMAPIRQTIPHRTIFNILGPLINPLKVKKQLIGVFDVDAVEKLANVLKKLGTDSAVIVSSHDGFDEFSLTGINHVAQLKEGHVHCFDFDPRESGYPFCSVNNLRGGTSNENAERLKKTLKGHSEPLDHMVHINAAWALVVAGKAEKLLDGLLLAQDSISSGRAYEKLEALIEESHKE